MFSSPEEILKTLPLSDENLHLLTEIFEVIPLQIAIKSLREESYGAFATWNRGAEVGLGITSGEALGLTDADLFPAEQAAVLAEADREVERTGEAVITRESISTRANGPRLRRTIKTPVFDADEKLVAILQVSEDITDHHGKDKTDFPGPLNSLFPGAVFQFRVDAEGRTGFPYISEGVRQLTGDDAGEVMRGRANPLSRLLPEDLPGYLMNVAKSRRELSPCRQEFRVRTKEGEIRWLSSTSLPRQEADGATVWQGFLTDVTRAKHSTDAQALGEERLHCALAGTNSAAWGVDLDSGELYLSSEWGNLFDFGRESFPRTFEEWLVKFHLDDVEGVNALRNTEPAHGEVRREFRHICGDGRYRPVLMRTRPVSDQAGRLVRLAGTITRDSNTPAPAPSSHPKGSEAAQILSGSKPEIRDLLHAVIGYSEILAAAPLEPEQLNHVWNIHEKSTELLQILSDGPDSAKFETAPGTTCTATPAVSTQDRSNESGPAKRSCLGLLDHPAKILVVDDNTTSRQLVRLLLRHLGHKADEAVNGSEGVEKATSANYDLILMDLLMPEMDGFEAARRIRKGPNGSAPLIVALTAHALAEHREQSLEAGMDACLNKPVTKADLEAILNGAPDPRQTVSIS